MRQPVARSAIGCLHGVLDLRIVGNHTGMWVNGVQPANYTLNDANQVIGWSYDAAGNLLSDGTTTRSYDALNRLVAQAGTSYTYNGDGVLVSNGTTTYAQDLAAPLSQVLSDGTDNYVYGHDRLRALGGPWYVGDALGSVRQTLDDAGAVVATTSYDPWGVPTTGTPQPFGFTGELHSAGQVYLRARWYAPGNGTFTRRDPFAGWATRPYSLHSYQYAYSNPVRWTDPSGQYPPYAAVFTRAEAAGLPVLLDQGIDAMATNVALSRWQSTLIYGTCFTAVAGTAGPLLGFSMKASAATGFGTGLTTGFVTGHVATLPGLPTFWDPQGSVHATDVLTWLRKEIDAFNQAVPQGTPAQPNISDVIAIWVAIWQHEDIVETRQAYLYVEWTNHYGAVGHDPVVFRSHKISPRLYNRLVSALGPTPLPFEGTNHYFYVTPEVYYQPAHTTRYLPGVPGHGRDRIDCTAIMDTLYPDEEPSDYQQGFFYQNCQARADIWTNPWEQ